MPAEFSRPELIDAAHVGVLFSLGLPDTRFTRKMVGRFFGRMISTVIDFGMELDRRIAADGVQQASRWASERCGAPVQAVGQALIPRDGPLLVAANHPGYFDSTAVLSQVPRDDVKIIVAVTYFNFLPNAVPHLIYTDRSPASNIRAVREAIKHLKAGGALLLFPTGHNDPDPAVLPGAVQRFEAWSDSVSLMLRKVPETQLVLSAISGIVAPEYLNHPIARVQRKPLYRQRVAELFQIFDQFTRYADTPLARPKVSFAPPLPGAYIEKDGREAVNENVIVLARQLLSEHLACMYP